MVIKYTLLWLYFLLFQQPFTVKSPDFANNHYIQFKFTCDGQNISPGLVFENIPKNTKCFALIMEDADVASGEFVHWLMWNIPVRSKLLENTAPGIQGKNGHKQNVYFGPCPPNGEHTYHFKVFALNQLIKLSPESGKAELLKALEGHVLAQSELIARYIRH